MNRLTKAACVIAVFATLIGCKHEPPTYTVVLLDTSKSITPDGIQDEFKAVDALVDQMKREDHLTVIPITGNATSEIPGHILRFSAPSVRGPFDHELVTFRKQAHSNIDAMRTVTIAHPPLRTDILGTLEVAQQEFAGDVDENLGRGVIRKLLVLSDFVEDDDTFHFTSDTALATDAGAKGLAECIQKTRPFAIDGAQVKLVALESTDQRKLTTQRQRAIRTFWSDYLAQSKPSGPTPSGAVSPDSQ